MFPSCDSYSGQFELPTTIYGRDHEKATILGAYERMRQAGNASLILVAGDAGIGKSALIHDLRKSMLKEGGRFISGKCDQYRNNVPYSSLKQAFGELLHQLLAGSESDLAHWRERILEAVGMHGQVVADILPPLRLVIGNQPTAPEVPDSEAQRRIFRVFRQFIAVFSERDCPLVLFLDDIQWIDNASRQLVEYLLTESDIGNLLVIAACRNDESDDQRRLEESLAMLRRCDVDMLHVVLAPLPQATLTRLIMDTLRTNLVQCEPLAALIFKRSHGNPLFFVEFLRTMKNDGLLHYDTAAGRWTWNPDRIADHNLPDTMLELMLGKMQRLPSTTQYLLQVAACIGNTFALTRLALVTGMDKVDTLHQLAAAVDEGLIRLADGHGRFLHDRIQQTAYSTIPEEELAATHLGIARVSMMCRVADDEDLFDLVNHFNHSTRLLTGLEERERVASLNLQAGRKAKSAAAYAAAGKYFAAGVELLSESSWQDSFRLAFDLRFEQAHCALMSGHLDDAMHSVDLLLQQPMSKPDLASATNLKVLLHVLRSENIEARDCGLACLRRFGMDLPAHPTFEQIKREYDLIWENMHGREVEDLIELPLMTNPDMQAISRVLSSLILAGAFTDMKLVHLVLSHMVNFCLRHGITKELVYGLGSFEVVAGAQFRQYSVAYRFTCLADRLVDKHAFMTEKAKSLMFIGLASFWTQPLKTSIENIESCFHAAIAGDDLAYACYSLMFQAPHQLMAGMPLDALSEGIEKKLGFVRRLQVRDAVDNLLSQSRFVAALQGRTRSISDFNGDSFEQQSFEAKLHEGRMPQIIGAYWILRLQAYYLAQDYANALEVMKRTEDYFWAAANSIYEFMHVYFNGLVMAASWDAANPKDHQRWLPMIERHQKLLSVWATHQPATFGDKSTLLLAEISRIEGRDLDAARLYEQAVSAAQSNGFVQFAGIACERAAEFHRQRGSITDADHYVLAMRQYFLQWGAHAKVAHIDSIYPLLRMKK